MPIFVLWIIGFFKAIPAWLWKYIAIAAAILFIFFYGEQRGKRIARAQCEAAAQRAQKAANDQDLQAEREGREQDVQITDELVRQKKVDDDIIENLRKELARRPAGAACIYDKSNADPDSGNSGSVREQPHR